MNPAGRSPSPRQEELLEAAYGYLLRHGLSDLSLRPLAAAIGSSPRVLLYLFGSKDDLVRALLEKARDEELVLLDEVRDQLAGQLDLAAAVRTTWAWLSAEEHRPLLCLWVEVYARSLVDPDGPHAGFATRTVEDWLSILAEAQPPRRRRSKAGLVERTGALAVLRGALLDLLATGETDRTGAAVARYADSL
jgi:AcrR family transcriptional regulator